MTEGDGKWWFVGPEPVTEWFVKQPCRIVTLGDGCYAMEWACAMCGANDVDGPGWVCLKCARQQSVDYAKKTKT